MDIAQMQRRIDGAVRAADMIAVARGYLDGAVLHDTVASPSGRPRPWPNAWPGSGRSWRRCCGLAQRGSRIWWKMTIYRCNNNANMLYC